MTKQCSKCGEIKDISEFGKNKARKDKHANICKVCTAKTKRTLYLKNNKETVLRVAAIKEAKVLLLDKGLKKCSCCLEIKPLTDFKRDPRKTGGVISQCKECASRKAKEQYLIKNYDKVMENRKKEEEKRLLSERGLKKCPCCNNAKSKSEFYKNRTKADGYDAYCKNCSNTYRKETQQENIKKSQKKYNDSEQGRQYKKSYYKEHKEKISINKKNWKLENREVIRVKDRVYRKKNKEALVKYNKEYLSNNKEKMASWRRTYAKDRYANNIQYKLRMLLAARMNDALSYQNVNKTENTMSVVGCSKSFLKEYLESLFTDGMAWDNHGLFGWHIDHIKPCASFDLTDPEQQKECFHYTNLQPLWAEDNLSKSDKLDWVKEA